MSSEVKGISVKFGANTVEFEKSVKGMSKALNVLKKDFQNINKSLKFDPDNVEKLEAKYKNLQQQIEVNESKIKELRKEQDKLGADKIGTAEWQKLENEIGKCENNLTYLNKTSAQTKQHMQEVGDPKSVYNLDKALDEVASDLDTVNKKLKLNPNDVEASKEKMKLLSKQTEIAETKVDTLKKTQSELGKEKIGTAEWKKLEKQIVEAQLEVEEFKSDMKSVDDVDLNKIGSKIDTTNIMNASQNIQQIGQKAIEAGAKSIEAFSEIDEGLDTIVAKTGEAGDGYQDMVKSIAGKIPVDSYATVGEAIGEVRTQFNLTGAQLENTSTKFLKFAKLNNTDVTTSVQNAEKVISLFGMSADDIPGILDTMTKAGQNTGVSIDDLFSTVQSGAPTLQKLGFSFEESVSLLSKMEQAGFKGQKSMSALTKATAYFEKQGKSASTGLKELEQGIKDGTVSSKELYDVFGTKNTESMVKAIKTGALTFQDLETASADAGGAVEDTFEKQLDNTDKLQIANQKLQSSFAPLGDTIAGVLAPALERLADLVAHVSTWFSSLSPTTQKVVVTIGAVASAIMVILPVIVSLITVIGMLKNSFSTGLGVLSGFGSTLLPLLPVILGIVAGVTAAILIFKNWNKIIKKLSGVWEQFKERMKSFLKPLDMLGSAVLKAMTTIAQFIGEAIGNAVKFVVNGLTAIRNGFADGLNKVKTIVSNVWNAIKTLFNNAINSIKTAVTNFWNNLKTTFSNAVNSIKTTVTNFWNNVKTAFTNAINSVKTAVTNFWNSLKTTFTNGVTNVVNAVTGLKDKVVAKFKAAFDAVKTKVASWWGQIKTKFSTGVTNAVNAIAGIKDKIINKFKSAFDGLKTKISGYWSGIKDKFSSGITSLVNVVSGIKQKIANKFSGLKNSVIKAIGNFKDIGKKIIDDIVSGITGLGKKIKAKITGESSSAKSGLGGILRGIFGKSIGAGNNLYNLYRFKELAMPDVSTTSNLTNNTFNIQVTAGSNAPDIARAVEKAIVRGLNL